MKHHNYYIYITTNPSKTVLYTGVTNNLAVRISEHFLNRGSQKSFAGKYYCYNLLYFEHYQYIQHAIARETEIKNWGKRKKLELIKEQNPFLKFYNEEICGQWPPPDTIEARQSNY
jgi:putative endonuclease